MPETEEQEQAQLHATIRGRVQGVGFRAFVEYTASQLGLTGWVRNRWDGSVEVLAEGERSVLEQFLAALQRGPRGSHVMDVQLDWGLAGDNYPGFFVRRTE